MSLAGLNTKRIVKIGSFAVALVVVPLVVSVLVDPRGVVGPERGSTTAQAFGTRGAQKVTAAYADWVKQHDANGGDRNVAVTLGHWKALSAAFTRARGIATLDLIQGTVSVVVSGLSRAESWDVWLVDHRARSPSQRHPRARRCEDQVGRLAQADDTDTLVARLGPAAFERFHVDLVVVAPAGGDPDTTGLLFGAPSLFQRLYTSLRNERLLRLSDFSSEPGITVKRPLAAVIGGSVRGGARTRSSSTRASSSMPWWRGAPTSSSTRRFGGTAARAGPATRPRTTSRST